MRFAYRCCIAALLISAATAARRRDSPVSSATSSTLVPSATSTTLVHDKNAVNNLVDKSAWFYAESGIVWVRNLLFMNQRNGVAKIKHDITVEEMLGKRGSKKFAGLVAAEMKNNMNFLRKLIDGTFPQGRRHVPPSVCRYFILGLVLHNCDVKDQEEVANTCQDLAFDVPPGMDTKADKKDGQMLKLFLKAISLRVAVDSACIYDGDALFNVDGKPWAIPILGPSAAGKTFGSTKTILPRILPTLKAAFMTIDGGTLRKASEMYQAMLSGKKETGFWTISDLKEYFKKYDEAHKAMLYKLVQRSGANVLWPDTAPHAPAFDPAQKFGEHIAALRDGSHKYNVFVAVVSASKDVATCQGTRRAKDESKPYSDQAWPLSTLGINYVLDTLHAGEHPKQTQAMISFTQLEDTSLQRCLQEVHRAGFEKLESEEYVDLHYVQAEPIFVSADTELRVHFQDDDGMPPAGRDPMMSYDAAAFWSYLSAWSSATFFCNCKETSAPDWRPCAEKRCYHPSSHNDTLAD